VDLCPKNGSYWNTLGVAQYRTGNWSASIGAIEKSMELRGGGGDSFGWFFLAMAHWQQGNRDEARAWLTKATAWMDQNKPYDGELCRFRTEAQQLIGPLPATAAMSAADPRSER
jgi:hypothetical protein